MPPLQSAYRRHHSTDTALLRVMADVFAADDQRVVLLALLELSAAINCVDHDILLMRLQRSVRLSGCVIDWIRSFLVDRTQRVAYAGGCSWLVCLLWGVPQGSVLRLGPLLFLRPSFSTLSQHMEQQPTPVWMTVNCTSTRWRLMLQSVN